MQDIILFALSLLALRVVKRNATVFQSYRVHTSQIKLE